MSTTVHRNQPGRRAVCWGVGVGLLLCGCRSPLFTAGMNDPSPTSRESRSTRTSDRDANHVPAWKRDFDRYVAEHKRQTSSIRQASAEIPAAGSANRTRKAAKAVSGESISELLNRGHRAAAAGRTAEALRAYRRVLVDDPENAVAHHRLAIIADGRHDFDSADYHYHRALRADPNDPDLLSDIGYSYLLQERYQESEDFLREAVRQSPRHRRAWSNLGLLYAVQGDYNRSLESFRRSGTEREAQSRVAALFPNGRPANRPAARQPEPAQPRDSVRAPQPVPARYSQQATGDRSATLAAPPPIADPGRQSVPGASESLTRQLQAAMVTARAERQPDRRSTRFSSRRTASAAGHEFSPRGTTSLSGNRINRAFADIDRRAAASQQRRLVQRTPVPSMGTNLSDRRSAERPAERSAEIVRGESPNAISPARRGVSPRTAVDRISLSPRRSRTRPTTTGDTQRGPAASSTPVISRRSNSSPATRADSSLLWPPSESYTGRTGRKDRRSQPVRQTGFDGGSRTTGPATSLTEEARQAARIGLAAGPGAVIPNASGAATGASETASRATPSTATTASFRPDSSETRFSAVGRRQIGNRSQRPVPGNQFGGRAGGTSPRRLPSTTTDRLSPSQQMFVPAPKQPTGYQMRSEAPPRVDPPPYQPERHPMSAGNRSHAATARNQPPRYGYQPLPYRSQGSEFPTGRPIQAGLTRKTRQFRSPPPYQPQAYRPQSGAAARQVTPPYYGRPQITPDVSSAMPGGSDSRLPTQQGERPFTAPPTNARPVIVPQQFLPR